MWEYLKDETGRAKAIASWIEKNGGAKDKVIVEIDCGVASLSRFLTGFKEYHGNDISGESIDVAKSYNIPNTFFIKENSSNIRCPKIDILVLMGVDIHEEGGGVTEFIRLIDDNNPEIAIFEGIEYWEKVARLFKTICRFMQIRGYKYESEQLEISSKYRNTRQRKILYFKK